MIDELKTEVEKTLGRKIVKRGDCELLADDLYQKTGSVISYNTFRRLFGIVAYRQPRESTLDALAKYVGFASYQDFTKRFSEVDTWPNWEHLYVVLSETNPRKIVDFLRLKKRQQDQFTVTFTIVIRELLHRKDLHTLRLIFREPMFQFSALPYDEVAQIGVLIGLHFRVFDDRTLEQELLKEANFRDIVFKIFVDYGRLNQKYGQWLDYLDTCPQLDPETRVFISCLQIWRAFLHGRKIEPNDLKKLPNLTMNQHPILFGRLFGLKMLAARTQQTKLRLKQAMEARLKAEPHMTTELLYEPAVQALVLKAKTHEEIITGHMNSINQINFWYHMSQVAIHRVLQVKMLVHDGQYLVAQSILDHIPYGHIRHGYREFIELYVAFFRFQIALGLGEPTEDLELEFKNRRLRLSYPILTDAYFEAYFEKN